MFQEQQGITVDGVVGRETWNAIVKKYDQTLASIPLEYRESADEIYPGKFLALGQSGNEVEILQQFLLKASQIFPNIPTVAVTGNYDELTASAVRVVQEMEGLPVNGVTGPLTWDSIVSLSKRESSWF